LRRDLIRDVGLNLGTEFRQRVRNQSDTGRGKTETSEQIRALWRIPLVITRGRKLRTAGLRPNEVDSEANMFKALEEA
jgi:hypothetical protein